MNALSVGKLSVTAAPVAIAYFLGIYQSREGLKQNDINIMLLFWKSRSMGSKKSFHTLTQHRYTVAYELKEKMQCLPQISVLFWLILAILLIMGGVIAA